MVYQTTLSQQTALEFLEKGGKWQRIQLLVMFMADLTSSFQSLMIVFTGFQPKFSCRDHFSHANATDENVFDDSCYSFNSTTNTSAECSGSYIYDINKDESIVSDWDLICSYAYLSETSQLLYTLGNGVGSIIFPRVADRWGRRGTFLALRVVDMFCAFGLVAVPNITWFMVIRFIQGAAQMGMGLVMFVLLVELSSVRFRPLLTAAIGIIWPVALCTQSLVGYLMRGTPWRTVQAVMAIPTLGVLLDFIFMKESILWLFANNKTKEASSLLQRGLKTNGVPIQVLMKTLGDTEQTDGPQGHQLEMSNQDGGVQQALDKERGPSKDELHKPISIMDILKNKSTRFVSALICYAWFVNSLVYYGIFFMSDALAGERILNFFLSSIVEIPSVLVLYYFLQRFQRKKLLVGYHALCGVSMLTGGVLVITLESQVKFVVMQVVTFIGKFGITASFILIYVYSTEVYPTNYRASGLGMGSTAARIGSLMSPFSRVMARQLPWAPGVIFGTLCLILAICLAWAPETKNRRLPQSIAEVESLHTGQIKKAIGETEISK